jgi:tetratricopeptide (TPR) repeat protein
LTELKRLVQNKSQEAQVYEALGEWLEALAQKPKAVEAYQRALDFDPHSPAAAEGLRRIDKKLAPQGMVKALYRNLSKLNYYQLLGIPKKSNVREIQKAYRMCSKHFHPDRFFQSEDEELKYQAKEAYKRVVDAYMTLKNETKRKKYDRSLSAQAATAADTSISGAVSLDPTEPPKTQRGKKFYDLALAALREGKLDSAKLNLQLGLQVEPDCLLMKKKLEEITKPQA